MTLSHPALILPLRRLPLPTAALALGSMVPDIPMFLPERRGYGITHSLAGVATLDVLAALVLLIGWDRVVRDALVDQSPSWVRDRLPRRARLSRGDWVLAPLAALLGSVSHVAWDAFTHPGRWGVAHVEWLGQVHAGLPGHKWAQHLSGAIGLALVIGACVAHVRARPPHRRTEPRALAGPVLPCALALVGATAALAGLEHRGGGLQPFALHAVVTGIQAGALAGVALCLAWLAASRRTRRRRETSEGAYAEIPSSRRATRR